MPDGSSPIDKTNGQAGRAGAYINDFLPFAIRRSANVEDQADYEKSDVREDGFEKGILPSAVTNKIWRQAAFVASATAEMVAQMIQEDVRDDGNIIKFVNQLIEAISNIGGPIIIDPLPPIDPKPGTLWFDPDTAQLYVYFDDGNSIQWVIANHVGGGAGGGTGNPYVLIQGSTMTGPLILSHNPTLPMEAATKEYVDVHTSVAAVTAVLVSGVAALRIDGGTY